MAKSKYHAKIKNMRAKHGGRSKRFNKGGSRRWLKTRHRVKHELLR